LTALTSLIRCIALNIASLVCGFVGNLFLLFNFTKRIRYIVALPATIILFYFACGILIGITSSMAIYVPPRQGEVYSQGFWHAVIAACLYLFCSMILMINMLGYFLGHYPQHFTLTDEQRNLILQTMMFFLWLAGGAAVFGKVEGWSYVDSLYFCDVSILTIGFGDFYPTSNTGRGLIFPFSVGGIVILGLMVSSIHKFAGELSKDNVIRKHMESRRVNTLSRAVTLTEEEQRRDDLEKQLAQRPGYRPSISSPMIDFDPNNRQIQFARDEEKRQRDAEQEPAPSQFVDKKQRKSPIHRTFAFITAPVRSMTKVTSKKPKALIMKEEKDRFDAMRGIQTGAAKFKKWYALLLSVIAFGVLWGVGAIVFWQCEKHTQGLTYFEALYFCYVSLLTIGYGDFSPKSNAGKPFFIVWSLIAVPTMTILISDMGDTVISSFKQGTFKLADFTVLPKDGLLKEIVDAHPWLKQFIQSRAQRKRIKKGLQPEGDVPIPTIDELVNEDLSEAELTKKLAFAIRRSAEDMKHHERTRYSYEEWVEFTRLIRFTKTGAAKDLEHDEEVEGIVEWDWLSENSPMLSEQSEAEWVLDRLCESLLRLLKKNRLATIAEVDGANDPDSVAALSKFGFSPLTRKLSDEEIDPRQKDPSQLHTETPISPSAERRQRATGADKLLTFFTGERRGAHAYATKEPVWSGRALDKINERRRSSAGVGSKKKGPFKMVQSRTGAMGGGRGGAGARTLKARAMLGSVDF
jgi:potassium channel subfamily K, other eukaryote